MKKFKLTKEEQQIEDELLKGNYTDVSKSEFDEIAKSILSRKKNAVLNIRVNKKDIESIKKTAKKLGIGYQSLISELIHRASKSFLK